MYDNAADKLIHSIGSDYLMYFHAADQLIYSVLLIASCTKSTMRYLESRIHSVIQINI